MREGASNAKKTVTPVGFGRRGDGRALAQLLDASGAEIRRRGLAVRTGPARFVLERSVGNVVLHLREFASSRRGADGVDAVKASAALKAA